MESELSSQPGHELWEACFPESHMPQPRVQTISSTFACVHSSATGPAYTGGLWELGSYPHGPPQHPHLPWLALRMVKREVALLLRLRSSHIFSIFIDEETARKHGQNLSKVMAGSHTPPAKPSPPFPHHTSLSRGHHETRKLIQNPGYLTVPLREGHLCSKGCPEGTWQLTCHLHKVH